MSMVRNYKTILFILIGILAFGTSMVSIIDMVSEKPTDGIESLFGYGKLKIEEIVSGGPADKAGLVTGDKILGIANKLVKSPLDVATVLVQQKIGAAVPYLIFRNGENVVVDVTLGKHRIGDFNYGYYAFLGFLFFSLGLFMFLKRPEDKAVHIFYLMNVTFMLFLVCRQRPASYYWVDFIVQNAGNLSLFFLPALFLHFFLVFPEKSPLIIDRSYLLWIFYMLPPIFFLHDAISDFYDMPKMWDGNLINWVLLVIYFAAGITLLFRFYLLSDNLLVKKQVKMILIGILSGVVPFLVFTIILDQVFGFDTLTFLGIIPLIAIPASFAYAIVRFGLMDISIIIRKSLVYSFLTFTITGVYAVLIVAFNTLFSGYQISQSPFFPILFAAAIIFLFNPLKERIQSDVNRLFYREKYDYQNTVKEISETMVSVLKMDEILKIIIDKVLNVMHIRSGALFLNEKNKEVWNVVATRGKLPKDARLEQNIVRSIKTRKTVMIRDLLSKSQRNKGEERLLQLMQHFGVNIFMPLLYKGKVLGILAVGEKMDEGYYTAEDIELLKTLVNQSAIAIQNAYLLNELTHQAEIKRDMDIAYQIQNDVLPKTIPKIKHLDIAAISLSARRVGGDFYDFITYDGDDQRIGIVVGDVSGKGIPAAMTMMMAKEVIASRAEIGLLPSSVIIETNRRLFRKMHKGMFLTIFYSILDTKKQKMYYSSGGHPLPLFICCGNENANYLKQPKNRFPIGFRDEIKLDEMEVDFKVGDRLLLYTDGAVEAMNENREEFEEHRLERSFERCKGKTSQETIETILKDIKKFTGHNEQNDDITLISVQLV